MARKPAKAAKPRAAKAAKPKAEKAAKPTKARGPKKIEATSPYKIDPDMRILARQHRDAYVVAKEALNKAQRRMQKIGKDVKADGLTMRQIKLMVELSTPEGEQAFRLAIADDLIAAQYQGAEIGQQLNLFMQPDRTPSGDIAYDEGQQDCMDGKTANPKYDPSVPQHESYMKGYHDETERRLKSGIKKKTDDDDGKPKGSTLITKGEKDAAAKAAADKAEARSAARAPVPSIPPSGTGMSRSDYKASKDAARAAAEAVFDKPAAGTA